MKVVMTLEDGRLPHVHVTDGIQERTYDTTLEMISHLLEEVGGDGAPVATWHTSPILPPQTILWASRTNGECVVFDIPAGMQPWVLQTRTTGTTSVMIPLPRLLFLFQRHGNRITHKALVAVDEEGAITPETPLFAYPLSNVYDDTNCCWHLPDKPYAVADLPGLMRAFFTTPNNWDLYQARNLSQLDYRGLIHALTERETFPSEWLRPLGMTWHDWIQKFAPSATEEESQVTTTDHITLNGGSDHAE